MKLLRIILVALILVQPLLADIAYVSTTTGNSAASGSLTYSVTIASCTPNCALIVAVGSRAGSSHDSVTFNGTGLTSAIDTGVLLSEYECSIWYLLNPAVTTANVVVTTSGATVWIGSAATQLSGVKQTSPVDDTGTNSAGTASTVSMSGLTSTVVNTGVMDCAVSNAGTGQMNLAMASESNRVQRANISTDPGTFDDTFASSTLIPLATASSPSLTWNSGDSSGNLNFAVAGVAFLPAASSSTYNLRRRRN